MKPILALIIAAFFVFCPSLGHSAVTTGPTTIRFTADGDKSSASANRTVGSVQVTSVTAGKYYRLISGETLQTSSVVLFEHIGSTSGNSFNAVTNDLRLPSSPWFVEYDTNDTTTGTGHSLTVFIKSN